MLINSKIQEQFDNLRNRAISCIPMKVCMMGPRAVGKTTILTSIFSDSQENLGSATGLSLKAEGDTDCELTKKKRFLSSVFLNRTQITDRPPAGLEASSKVNTFDFAFGQKDHEPRIDLEIKDFPGEYVNDKPEEVKRFINESTAVFIAIDTPHLMEEEGKYCEVKNKPSVITKFFLDLMKDKQFGGERLVLLIPLKCERYYYEKCMGEVLERVEKVYSDLIASFRENGKIACAVTPILTLGGVEYESMKKSENGEVALNMNNCPEEVFYRFIGENPNYSPLYCVQPLYYMLSFLAAKYEREKKNRSIWDRLLSSIFNLFDSDTELFQEVKRMDTFRKKNLSGYRVECGMNLFNFN